ncbi:hypothetical protein BKP30_27000 [Rhodococcus erythropolis]|nr:hypothetical protein BKP30_27000 [Rhodococcus erythropolis]
MNENHCTATKYVPRERASSVVTPELIETARTLREQGKVSTTSNPHSPSEDPPSAAHTQMQSRNGLQQTTTQSKSKSLEE